MLATVSAWATNCVCVTDDVDRITCYLRIFEVGATLLSSTVQNSVETSNMSSPGVDREMMKTLKVCGCVCCV